MISENFIYLAIVISVIGGLTYFIDTLKGKTKPNRVTWFIWALAPMLAFFASISQGVGLQTATTFLAGFMPLLVFIASFINKNSYWDITKFDIVCGVFALLGIALWLITDEPNLAILMSIFADGMAGLPTIVKSYKEPATESYKVFLGGIIANTITLLTITIWEFQYYAFPLYLLSICSVLFVLIKFRIGPRVRHENV